MRPPVIHYRMQQRNVERNSRACGRSESHELRKLEMINKTGSCMQWTYFGLGFGDKHRQLHEFIWKYKQFFRTSAPHKAHQCIRQRHWPFHGTASRAPADSKTNWSNWPAMYEAMGCNSKPKASEMLSNQIFRWSRQSKFFHNFFKK